MTKDQVKRQAELTLTELFDSFVLVGRVAGKKDCIVLCEVPDDVSRAQMTMAIANVVHSDTFTGIA